MDPALLGATAGTIPGVVASQVGAPVVAPPGLLLHLLGVFGPRAVPLLWWLARAAVAVGPAAAGATATGITGQDPLVPGISLAALLGLAAPALVASLAEEPGWRGAALDLWQTQARPVVAATGIGMLWSGGTCR